MGTAIGSMTGVVSGVWGAAFVLSNILTPPVLNWYDFPALATALLVVVVLGILGGHLGERFD